MNLNYQENKYHVKCSCTMNYEYNVNSDSSTKDHRTLHLPFLYLFMSYSSNGSGYVSDLKMNRSPKTQAGHSGCFIFSLPLCLHRGSVCLWTVASCPAAERLDPCLKAWVSPGHLQGCCPFLLCNFSSLIWPANSAHLKQTNKNPSISWLDLPSFQSL